MDKELLNYLTKIKINDLRYNLHKYNLSFGLALVIICFLLFFVVLAFAKKEMIFLLIVFQCLNVCIVLLTSYNEQKIDEELDCFENDLELYITGRAKYEAFEKIIKDLDRNKYHICRELDEDGYIKNWYIFRKDMSIDKYFSTENKPLLTSEDNDIFDLINFVKEE